MNLEKLGKYKLTGKIGKGAMGEVFRAHDPVLNREVAIKTISANLSSDSDLRKRFHREAQAAARLNHPNIITVFDFGEEQGVIYMAMELLEGADLKDLIGQKLLQTLEDKLDVMEQIADGLAFAHAHDIIHRDLKPGNVHVQPNGQIKILDFGLARLGGADLTRTGTVMGTPNYMSPEQVKGEKVDSRADIFSAGAVFYEVLTNRRPFDADSAHAVLFQVVHQAPKPVRHWLPDVPPILVQVVEKAMHKDREQRFRNGGELREALRLVRLALTAGRGETATLETEAVLAGVAVPGKEYKSPTQKPMPGRAAAAAAAAAPAPEGETRAQPRADMFTETAHPSLTPTMAPPPASKAPLYVGGALALVGIAAVAAILLRPQPQPAGSPAPGADAQVVGALTEALVVTQVELAKRDLDDKDYSAAVAQAERALKLSPRNAEAKAILDQAQGQIAAVESAASQARANLQKGDTNAAAAALSRLLALDPKHPAAAELSTALNKYFRSQAEDARRAAGQSRSQAERTKAAGSDLFTQAAAMTRETEGLLARGEFASATRGFLEARDAFEKTRRAAEAKPIATPAAIPSAPLVAGGVPAGEVPAAGQPGLGATAAPPSGATAPSAAGLAPVAPAIARRALVVGNTVVQAAPKGKGPAGFDSGDVLADRDFLCRLSFDVSPQSVGAGDSYEIKLYMVNDNPKPIKMKNISVTATVNGGKVPKPASSVKEAPPRQKTLLAAVSGTWEEGISTWTLDALVTSTRDDTCRSKVTLK